MISQAMELGTSQSMAVPEKAGVTMSQPLRVAVIGGGPAGLVTLKHLLAVHEFQDVGAIEAKLFESKEKIGGTFRYRVWEDAELVSSKYLTAFSDFRFADSEPDFPSTERYLQYLEDYATHFQLWPHINLSTRVVSVRRTAVGTHAVKYFNVDYGKEEVWECDAVAVCSGLHFEPAIPSIRGIENVPNVMHSSQFKGRKDFGDAEHIMVLGVGETAMDIAHLAVTGYQKKQVTLCHRGGFVYAPKILSFPTVLKYFNKGKTYKLAADTTIASLFDTAYVHPWLQKSPLLWTGYDTWAKFYFWLVSGTKHGVDQWVGGVPDDRYHLSSVILMKSGKVIPYISEGYRNRSILDSIRALIINIPLPSTGGRTIDLAPWPESIDKTGTVKFVPSSRPEARRAASKPSKPDVIVFATGYTQSFPFLDSTYPLPLHCHHRGIWCPNDISVSFIGFVRPSLGAIPPLCELQAQTWVLGLVNKLPPGPMRDFSYKLQFRQFRREYEQFVVDHESYAYQLALDMGAAPGFMEVVGFGWKVAFTWAMGSNFNSKFRLVGPWRWEGAREVMENELYDIVAERGFWMFFLSYTLIPFFIFGTLSAICWLLCTILKVINKVFKTLYLATSTEENDGMPSVDLVGVLFWGGVLAVAAVLGSAYGRASSSLGSSFENDGGVAVGKEWGNGSVYGGCGRMRWVGM